MSRHTIEANNSEKFAVVVGYDATLETYFGQVIDRQIEHEEEERAARVIAGEQEEDDQTPERDPVILWVGASVGEVPTVAELARLVEPYAVLTSGLVERLCNDQRREAHPATPLQRAMRGLTHER